MNLTDGYGRRRIGLAFLDKKVKVREMQDSCIVTLPMETVDKRKVSVVIDSIGDTFVVHDGGKTLSELFCHGVSMTDTRLSHQIDIAAKHGAHFKNKMIRVVCKREDLERAIFAVAQCSSMAMLDLVSHKARLDDDSVPSKVSGILDLWRPADVQISKNVDVRTVESDHRLNAVCRASSGVIIGVKVLGSDNPKKNAQQYGYMDLDMTSNDEYRNWARFAIVSGAENWNERTLGVVYRHATKVLEVKSKNEDEFLGRIPAIMSDLINPRALTVQ